MKFVARLGDKTIGSCEEHGDDIQGTIITASADITANNKPVARLGDKVLAECGHISTIITAGMKTNPNNKGGIARLGDQVGDSPYTAIIITSSTNVTAN